MFLVDANVWLEVLLEQERQGEANLFFQAVKTHHLSITEFTLFSVILNLTRRREDEDYLDFLSDVMKDSDVTVIRLNATDLKQALDIAQKFTLDFDDAYQYVAAEKYGLTIVSFDAHFDRTERGRKTPGQALVEYCQRKESDGIGGENDEVRADG